MDQVWVVTPLHYHYLTQTAKLTNVYLTPLWNFVDTGVHFREKRESSILRCEPLNIKQIIEDPNTQSGYKVGRCSLYRNGCSTTSNNSLLPCPKSKVIFFGVFGFQTSKLQENRKLCFQLKTLLPKGTVECLEGGQWRYLRDYLSETEIIVLNGLIRPSMESHFADQFLYHGKVIISTHSEDLTLDNSYHNIINFVNSPEKIPPLIIDLLNNPEIIKNQSIQASNFIKDQVVISLLLLFIIIIVDTNTIKLYIFYEQIKS